MNFWVELKRRNVFRVGIAYVVIGWIIAQVTELALDSFGAPDWVMKTILLLLALGLPVALFFAWAFELTPEGVKRERDVVRDTSITHETAKKLDIVTIVAVIGLVGFLLADRFLLPKPNENTTPAQTVADTVSDDSPTQLSDDAEKPDNKSIAVLPFTTRSENESDIHFSDGMHDDLLTQLAKIRALKVISRTSVMDYRDTSKKIPEIAKELGVSTVLEGAVQRAGKRVRINAQLIDADTDEHLWAETFDRELTVENIFDIQSEIALAITAALQASLAPEERSQIGQVLTNNLDAWQAYQQASMLGVSTEINQIEQSLVLARKAIKLDPQFAAAYGIVARSEMAMFWFSDPSQERLQRAWSVIETGRAVDADQTQLDKAEAYYYYWGFQDFPKALAAVERGLTKTPNDSELHAARGFIHRRMGNYSEALANFRKASELAPRDIVLPQSMAETATGLQDWSLAERQLDIVATLDSEDVSMHIARAFLLSVRDGNQEEALRIYRQYEEDYYSGRSTSFFTLVSMERWDEALAVADFGPKAQLSHFGYWPVTLNKGMVYLLKGDQEKARPLLLTAHDDIKARLDQEPEAQRYLQAWCKINGALANREVALEACAKAERMSNRDKYSRDSFWLQEIAGALTQAGEHDRAMEILELWLASDIHTTSWGIKQQPVLRGLQQHEGFAQLLERFDK